LRIVFDKNVPVGVRHFLSKHEVHTFAAMQWHPQMGNGELLAAAEAAGFDLMVNSDQNIRYQQNLTGRNLALVVLGSNIWPVVRDHEAEIAAKAMRPKSMRQYREAMTSSKCRCRRSAEGMAVEGGGRFGSLARPRYPMTSSRTVMLLR
jgi:hypothetical protein